jgi:formylglycine-generating enzyme required for sulfatase activity
VRDGRDETPADEPEPLVTVDRLLLLRLRHGVRGRVQVLLRGDCAGTMVNLAARESCTDSERVRAPVTEEMLEEDPSIPTATAAGTWGAEPCPDTPPGDRACVPGGAAILGSEDLLIYPDLAPVPERVVRLSRFWVDRDEVSVGRYRAALAGGFQPSGAPVANDAALGTNPDTTACTWSTQPMDREGYGLSCITWERAREFCHHEGGELPTEAQWEYLAATAGRAARTRFPWGDDPPSCERAVYGRAALAGSPGVCESAGRGPQPLALADADALGVRGLGGGLAEYTRDVYADYAGKCWQASHDVDPGCFDGMGQRSVRGGSWAAPPATLRSAMRLGAFDGGSSFLGFRCVYPEAGP